MRRNLFFILAFVMLIGIVSATTTPIFVKTVPSGNVNLNVKDAVSMKIYENFNANADEYGDLFFTFTSDVYDFDIGYFIKDPLGKKLTSGLIKNQQAGEPIYLELVPEGFKIVETPNKSEEPEVIETVSNETLIEETNSTEESNASELLVPETAEVQEKTEKLTAFSISKDNVSISTQVLYYALGIIVLVVLLFVFLKKRKNRIPSSKEIKIKKLSELKKDKEERIKEQEDVIKEAEKKLDDAKKELDNIKKEDKISDLKKKIIEEEKELMRLRREGKDEA